MPPTPHNIEKPASAILLEYNTHYYIFIHLYHNITKAFQKQLFLHNIGVFAYTNCIDNFIISQYDANIEG